MESLFRKNSEDHYSTWHIAGERTKGRTEAARNDLQSSTPKYFPHQFSQVHKITHHQNLITSNADTGFLEWFFACLLVLFRFFLLILERGREMEGGGGGKETSTSCLPYWPETQVCALSGYVPRNLLVQGTTRSNQLSRSGRDPRVSVNCVMGEGISQSHWDLQGM